MSKKVTYAIGNTHGTGLAAQRAGIEVYRSVKKRAASSPQHRTLTVLFCDLVDSTQLSVHLNSSDLRKLLLAYYNTCSQVIQRHNGVVIRYVGDCVLAVFGYPDPRGYDASNAASAGLEVVERMQPLSNQHASALDAELAVRVTAATGRVISDELIGEGPAQQTGVFGQTPYLAARLKNAAAPNTVVVAPNTHALVSTQFETEDLGDQNLKGFNRPVKAWRVVQPKCVEQIEESERKILTIH